MINLCGLIYPNRRDVIVGSAASLFASRVAKAQLGLFASFGSSGSGAVSGFVFPGLPGNPVGYAYAPGYSGSLTLYSGAFVSGSTYNFLDVDSGTGGVQLASQTNVVFNGCRFQSNDTGNYNFQFNGTAGSVTFNYCSFVPRVALVGTTPPGAGGSGQGGLAWPSAGAGLQTITFVTGTNCIANASGYQYGMSLGPSSSGIGAVTLDHCDLWGFANAVVFYSTTSAMVVRYCWIHDARNAGAGASGDHTDGLGYLNGGIAPKNITISGCTVASIGNTNAFAFQGGTGSFDNYTLVGNFLSGFGYTCFLFDASNTSNVLFENNTFGTDLPWEFGPFHGNYAVMFSGSNVSGNVWRGNTLRVLPGTSAWAGSTLSWTSGDNGKFLWPDTTLHVSDFS